MVTKENLKTEFKKLDAQGLCDKEAKDLEVVMEEMLPYYDDAPEVKKEFDLALDAINENVELNRKAKGGSLSDEDAEKAKAKRKRMIKIKLALQLQLAEKRK